jgi:hypothetical protein
MMHKGRLLDDRFLDGIRRPPTLGLYVGGETGSQSRCTKKVGLVDSWIEELIELIAQVNVSAAHAH